MFGAGKSTLEVLGLSELQTSFKTVWPDHLVVRAILAQSDPNVLNRGKYCDL